MTYAAADSHTHTEIREAPANWLRRAEMWLDARGKGAWIASMVLAFIFVWPLGLFLLFYMIWGKKMFACSKHRSPSRAQWHSAKAAMRPSGNSAFDAYKSETLSRLESEQDQFESFLERLRAAKDKAEFDEFMEARAKDAKKAAKAAKKSEELDDVEEA